MDNRSSSLWKILLVASFFSLPLFTAAGAVHAGVPEQMPQFALPSAIDDTVIDSSQHKGKILLINFWATWCGPCREEIPSLVSLQSEHGAKGFSVIGIAMDESSRKAVDKFAKKTGITYPVAMGNTKTARAFGGIAGIPQSFLVNRDGIVVKSYMGLVEKDQLEQDIAPLLK